MILILITDENCNKIIILPDQMSENCRVIKNMMKLGLINKLDKKSGDYVLRNSFSKNVSLILVYTTNNKYFPDNYITFFFKA